MSQFKIPSSEYQLSFSRSSGSGGQNINKVNSKATLQWNVLESSSLPPAVLERFLKKYAKKISTDGILTLSSQIHRSQHLNIAEVIKKLHEMIGDIISPPKMRKPTKPTKASVNARIKIKKEKGQRKKSRQEKF